MRCLFCGGGCAGELERGFGKVTCRKNSGVRVEKDRHLYQSLQLDKDANRSQTLKTGEHNTPWL